MEEFFVDVTELNNTCCGANFTNKMRSMLCAGDPYKRRINCSLHYGQVSCLIRSYKKCRFKLLRQSITFKLESGFFVLRI